jgi:hypothetical protein
MQKMLAGAAFALVIGGAALAQATDAVTTDTGTDAMEETFLISVDGTETEVTPEEFALVCPEADYSAAADDEVVCEITQAEADEAGIVVAPDVDALTTDDEIDADDDLAIDEVEGEEETQ